MAKAPILRTMEQQRASFALKAIKENKGKQLEAELRRYLIKLPSLIYKNGLGQALAFYLSKGGGKASKEKDSNPYLIICKIIGDWLCQEGPGQIFTNNNCIIEAIAESDMYKYMAAQNEALALLEWLKKFAVALLQDAESQEDSE